MEMLLLLVLILTEIGFAAFAMSGKITRGEWAKRRLCVSAVELVTFLVMTLLPGIDFSFRFKGVLVILVFFARVNSLILQTKMANPASPFWRKLQTSRQRCLGTAGTVLQTCC